MKRIYNFSAGPATLPEEVLKQASEEMLNYKDSGMSVMEMSHRSKLYQAIIDEAEADLRKILNMPDNYKVLFVQGGATLQFAMIPMNLSKNKVYDFIHTGQWTKAARREAEIYGTVNVIASSEDKNFTYIPNLDNLSYSKDADYVYICENNTIFGTKYKKYPDVGNRILINDMSSCFLSEPIDVSKFGVIFAGAQKNVGPAGVAIVIVRDDLLENPTLPGTPTLMNYKVFAEKGSMHNTPPTYTIYICGLVFKWIIANGGLEGIQKRNEKKATLLYDYLDKSKMFKGTVEKDSRSLMNVCFKTDSEELDKLFVEEAKKVGLENLKGHRSVGGMRASIYNAMPLAGVEALVKFMAEFESKHL